MNENAVQWRLTLAGVGLGLAMAGLCARLFVLHLGAPELWGGNGSNFAEEQPAVRGRIFDRNGQRNAMALDVAVKDVCADPFVVTSDDRASCLVSRLAPLLEMTEDAVAQRIFSRPGSRFAYVSRRVPEPVADRIAAESLPGVFFRDTILRRYPQGSSMGHVIGFVNYEGVGSAGVEQRMERFLRGAPGYLESSLNAKRQELVGRRAQHIPAVAGADVHLTLDQNIQHRIERILEDTVLRHRATAGLALVQRVRTGEILAMASWPFFDPNVFVESTPEQRRNRAIAFNYEPGSTFKPMVVAAALNEGLVTPETLIDCENGVWHYLNRPLRDVRPNGMLSVTEVVAKSSNIGTAKIGLRLGDRALYRYLRAFGFGERSGIDLPGEERGILHPVERWSRLDASRISIGQAVSVTPLQLLNAVCAIANDGILMRPHVVREIRGADGATLFEARPEALGQPIRAETARTIAHMMRLAVEEGGTGHRARLDDYETAGKTGTAQKVVDGVYSGTDYVASFVGFLPVENPEIGILVVVDEPRAEGYYGGLVAAPAFRAMAKETALYLDVLPTRYRLAQRP